MKMHTDPVTAKVKYASAHDLRRSFGDRWSRRVVLQELTRHEDIQTTLKCYALANAERTAAELWEAHKKAIRSNTSSNTSDFCSPEDFAEIDRSCDSGEVYPEVTRQGLEP